VKFKAYIWRSDNTTLILEGIKSNSREDVIEFVREVCYEKTNGLGFLINKTRWIIFADTVYVEFDRKNIIHLIETRRDMDEFLDSKKSRLKRVG